jgi:NADPH:quinone reductase-like Zn-dependent oxidoreductase
VWAATVNPMKAAVRTRYGSPDVVQILEVDKPTPQDGEVLVKIHATTVNRTDCGVRAAKPSVLRLLLGLRKPRRPVIGTEFAGIVEGLGSGVTSFKVGDRVFGYDERWFGAHAEYKSMRSDGAVAAIPPNVAYEQAAPGTEGSHYALGFIRKARIQKGQDVLVNGATGAIGSAAVQLLRDLGANVTAVCGAEHVDLVRGLGAARVIDYTAEDFTEDNGFYEVVLDAVGKSSFGRCKRLLKPGGTYLSSELGPRGQNPFLALITPLLGGKKVMFPYPRYDQKMVQHLAGRIESGAFMPVVDRVFPLEKIAEAYRYAESGQKVGNVVISLAPSMRGTTTG